jgi:glycosyltransferase involved in cell wall biosynthesis
MTCNFLMIARVLYDKGYSQYVESSKEIRSRYPNVKFQLLGGIDDEYPNAVPKEVVMSDNSLGYIEYLGYKSDVRQYILEADCIVHPTYYNEGLSRVLMEALALKKPIITTDIPGCRETVDDGVNGFLCQPKDVPSLVSAIENFMNLSPQQRQDMGNAGRVKAETQFDIRDVIAIYKSITDCSIQLRKK